MSGAAAAARCWAVVPAAGQGQRFSSSSSPAARKQYAPLGGRTVIEHALRPLLREIRIEGIVVPLAADDDYWPVIASRLQQDFPQSRKLHTCIGGADRQASVLNGLRELRRLAAPQDWVLVHDAARPCLSEADLARLLEALPGSQGALLALPLADTLKRQCSYGRVETVDRTGLWRALTPQGFPLAELDAALTAARDAGRTVTDEAQAMELAGWQPRLVAGDSENIKVTREQDLRIAARCLASGGEGSMRIGQGIDIHAFTDGDHVVLGGVRIPHTRGIEAHSDGDVIIHALCDALLGALGEGDIGRHFPDSDPRWRGADSRLFLTHVAGMMRAAGFALLNADISVTAQAPRLAAHAPLMRERLAADLAVEPARLNIKATTTEKLGFIGREEGLAAQAVVLLDAAGERSVEER